MSHQGAPSVGLHPQEVLGGGLGSATHSLGLPRYRSRRPSAFIPFDSPVVIRYPWGLGSRTPAEAQVHIRWPRGLHSVCPLHPQILNLESTVLDQRRVESRDEKPTNMKADCIFLGKKSMYKWTRTVRTHVQGSAIKCISSLSLVFYFEKCFIPCG